MSMNYLFGRTQPQLEADLAAAQAEFVKGKSRQGINTPDASVNFKNEISIKRRIREILYSLNRLDPVKYPDVDVIPVTAYEAQFPRSTSDTV